MRLEHFASVCAAACVLLSCVSESVVGTSGQASGTNPALSGTAPAAAAAAMPAAPLMAAEPLHNTVISGAANEWIGDTNVFLGDLDHDGLGDFAISAYPALPWAEPVVSFAATYIFYGKSSLPAQLQTADADAVIKGDLNHIAPLGDIDGDQHADIALVGASSAGILYGGAERLHGVYDATTLGIRWTGVVLPPGRLNMQFGTVSPYRIGDVNHDGIGDLGVLLITGFPETSPEAQTRSFVVFGRAARFTPEPFNPAIASAELAAPDPIDPFVGGAVLSLMWLDSGDFDGDGTGDLLAPSSQTRQHLFYGGPSKWSGQLGAAATDAALGAQAAPTPSLFAVGDVDGDGASDLMLPPSSGRGLGIVYGSTQRWSGDRELTPDLVLEPPLNSQASDVGLAIAPGDFDGDGMQDIVVALSAGYDSAEPGALYVIRGSGTRLVGRVNLTAEQRILQGQLTEVASLRGPVWDNDGLGHSLLLGDINGDGNTDILAGASGSQAPGALPSWSGGSVSLIPGSAQPPL